MASAVFVSDYSTFFCGQYRNLPPIEDFCSSQIHWLTRVMRIPGVTDSPTILYDGLGLRAKIMDFDLWETRLKREEIHC